MTRLGENETTIFMKFPPETDNLSWKDYPMAAYAELKDTPAVGK